MKEEKDLIKEAQRGEHAERVLKDPLVAAALKNMRETVFHNIRTSHYKNVEEREDLYKMLKSVDSFEAEFTRIIKGGHKARTLLEKLRGK